MRWSLILIAVPALAEQLFELDGRVKPEAQASVSIYGVSTAFVGDTLTGPDGRFKFKKLAAGSYSVTVLVAGRGEVRMTVEVGPAAADVRGRVRAVLELKAENFVLDARQRGVVSAAELAIPGNAHREFDEVQKALARRDEAGAVGHLEKAVEIAPRFELAWNNLGTIAYRNQQYPRAEECFRRALEANPDAYEALVNLGGVLINLNKLEEALGYNEHAVLMRPNDALANSQLGMTYFEMRDLDRAEKYLERARDIDPGAFFASAVTAGRNSRAKKSATPGRPRPRGFLAPASGLARRHGLARPDREVEVTVAAEAGEPFCDRFSPGGANAALLWGGRRVR